jgi:hypothetical protein
MRNILNPDKALVFRITHRDNLPWILANGLHCRNSNLIDPNFIGIGNPDLIDNRHYRSVPVPPGGSLSNYVPFYFTPMSVMLFNIKTGHRGIRQRRNDEIIILVSSLKTLNARGIRYLFTDRHAYLTSAQFYSHLDDLDKINWTILQNRDFRRDNDDLGKMERYQAEALVHTHLPVTSLLGMVCYNGSVLESVKVLLSNTSVELKVIRKPEWYF